VCVCWKRKSYGFNHKIMIIVQSRHLVLWLLGTMVYESLGKRLVVQGEDTSPPVHPI
jgi:hypothetical protein